MATISYIPTRRVIITALQRVVGSRQFVIWLSLLLGTGLFLWARTELNSMFARDETGEIAFRVANADPGCAPPSLYLLPDRAREGSYFVAFDMLGGGIGDPSIMNIGRPAVALNYEGGGADAHAERRATLAECRKMELAIGDSDARLITLTQAEIDDITNVDGPRSLQSSGDGVALKFDVAGEDESAARAAFRIEGVRDAWQYGYRRLNLWNSGRTPVNVFLLGEPGYSFLSENFDPIAVPVRNRSVVAMHLTAIGREGSNGYQAISRLIDYDARMQSRLIMVSTVFGIGISLMVEGLILGLLKLARSISGVRDSEDTKADLREDDGS